jgi:hypothetical protein
LTLPWWAVEVSLADYVTSRIPEQAEYIWGLLKEPARRRRWVLQFDSLIQKTLLEALAVGLPVQLEEWLTFSKPLDTHKAREIYWEVCWELSFEREKSPEDWWRKLVELSYRKDQQDLNLEIAPNVPSLVKTKSAIDSEGIYVPLAGIVLVHPFLQTFFNRVGLTREEAFIDPDTQESAVHVLYFIATRQEHPDEQELAVLKLLCGWELQAPIAKYIDLTANEKEQAEGMLQALIGQWSALEGSTTEELRGSFFIREGKLKTADLGWHLTVEKKSYNLLMNILSWELSPIQYPWMEKMFWVDWA